MTILRPSNAYCSGQLLHRVVPKRSCAGSSATAAAARRRQGGESYIHASDLARAIHSSRKRRAARNRLQRRPKEPTSIRRVVELCAEAVNVRSSNCAK